MSALSVERLLSEGNIAATNAEWHGGESIHTELSVCWNTNVNPVERRFLHTPAKQENTVPKPVMASHAAAERAERIFAINLTVEQIFARQRSIIHFLLTRGEKQ